MIDAVNKAFQFSSLINETLLDCWTIAWAIILTWFFLGTRYSLWQLFGAALCVGCLGLVLLSDSGVGGGGGSRPLLGDMLVIFSTVFFAMSNVSEIIFFSSLSMNTFITCQTKSYIFRFHLLGFAGFTVSSFMYYMISPFVLEDILGTAEWSDNVQSVTAYI
ncbi:hypothetical protein ACOSQ4_029331 [Xanthoceras sorbifolium]